MMKVNDKKIVNYIRFLPFYFLIATTVIFGIYIISSNHYNETKEKENLRASLESEYKNKIKQETLKVVSYINQLKSYKEQETIKLLKEKSETAYSIINSIYKNNSSKSKEEILSLIKDSLQDVRYFDGRGYYYIVDTKTGFCYFHPVFKQLENRSLLEIQDAKGLYLTKAMINVIKDKDEGYLNYHWYKQGDKINQYEKIAYLRKFEPLGFYFVISDYVDSINNTLKKEVKNYLHSVNFQDESHYFIINKQNHHFEFHENPNLIDNHISTNNYILETQKLLSEFENNKEGFHTYNIKLKDDSI